MTEHEALKQFIPILGRISTPYERATITHKITERIAGRAGDSIMAITHKHAGALAWPNDSLRAHQFELALNVATDSGEFLSFTRITRHLRIEELASWPNCPAIAPDSPLVYWLGEPAPAQNTATPAPVVPVSDEPAKRRRKTWRDVTEAYLECTFKELQCPTVKEFFAALTRKAGNGSPFDKGIGQNSGSLFARDVSVVVTCKMIEGFVTELRKKM